MPCVSMAIEYLFLIAGSDVWYRLAMSKPFTDRHCLKQQFAELDICQAITAYNRLPFDGKTVNIYRPIITFSKWLENSGAIFSNNPERCYSQIGIVEEKLFAIR